MADTAGEKTAKAFSAISPLLGLGAKVAGAVPGMKKAQQSKVRVSAMPIAQAAMGTAAQGHGVGRGGKFLQSLRHSGSAGQMVAQSALSAQNMNERTNIATEQNRRQRIGTFADSMAAGVSDLGVGLVDAANARKAERLGEQGAELTNGGTSTAGQPPAAGQNFISDAYGGQGEGGIDTTPPPLDDIINNPEANQADAIASLSAELEGLNNQQVQNRTEAFNQQRAINGMRPLDGLQEIAPDLEYRNRVINFGLDELDKRGLSLLNGLAPMARAMGTDLTQIMNPPMQSFFDDEDEENGA